MAKVVLWTSLLILISVASPSPVTPIPSGRCPDTWKVFGNSCYKLIEEKLSWIHAQVICKTVGSSLVIIESQEENEFVAKLTSNQGGPVWIGLTDLVQEGQYLWVDTAQVPKYTHWISGEPNSNARKEDCAALWKEGFWDDISCGLKTGAICEKHSSG